MSGRGPLPVYELTRALRNAATRTGLYAGLGMALILTTWLFIANRMTGLENLAFERNVLAAAAFGLVALVPVLRFARSPGNLLASSLIAWGVLTLAYSALGLHFQALSDRYSTPQILMLGSLVYMILATLSWIGTCIWKARASRVPHSNHRLS
jgi:hypothetical protein